MRCENHAISKYDLNHSHTEKNLRELLIGELPHPESDQNCRVTAETCENERELIRKYISAEQVCYSGDQIAKQLKKNFSGKTPSSVDIVLRGKHSGEYLLADCKYGCFDGHRILAYGRDFRKEVINKFYLSELFLKIKNLSTTGKRILIFNVEAKEVATSILHDLCLEQDSDTHCLRKYKILGTEEFSQLCGN